MIQEEQAIVKKQNEVLEAKKSSEFTTDVGLLHLRRSELQAEIDELDKRIGAAHGCPPSNLSASSSGDCSSSCASHAAASGAGGSAWPWS